jgi:hypothetical protein
MGMIADLFKFKSTRLRHTSAPLLAEREQYLAHLYLRGVSKGRVRTVFINIRSYRPINGVDFNPNH